MEVLFCTSEAFPLVKTGGLGDVCGSLPRALHELGNDVRLILPAYPEVMERAGKLTAVTSLTLTGASEPVEILLGQLPGSEVGLYLVNSPEHFRRPGNPYLQKDGSDWPDNAERFALFARAIVALALGQADTGWKPELVHCNDWQTGLVPALLSEHEARPATLFSIHNLSYQGLFPAATFTALELPDTLWSIDGLDQYRSANLTGILNGMDKQTWNPGSDPHIERGYDVHSLQHKVVNKFALQREQGLPVGSQPLLLGHIGRLVEQKGVDLILDSLDALFQHPIQMVILGSGDHELEQRLMDAADRYPEQLAVHIGYDEQLAHRIEAGADCLLIPSRYEPCGLNQMYSMAYGTIPIAHRTGGLADSIVDLDKQSERDYTATGFIFDEDSPQAILKTCLRALTHFQTRRIDWWKLVITGMKKDFSWSKSAAQYLELYQRVCNNTQTQASIAADSEHKTMPSQAVSV
jgi:starch synthase